MASALRGDESRWPQNWIGAAADAFLEAALYHGVAALLVEKATILDSWPEPLMKALKGQARAQAMWELRHRQVLSELLAELARAGVRAILMKGTAIAYALYANPASRSRADSDLLIAPDDRPPSRSVLESLGYRRSRATAPLPDEFALQEEWRLHCGDGSEHSIDLHWQVLNAPALHDVLNVAECAGNAVALPRLAPDALAMDRVRTLIHTCAHRALHLTAPYFAGGKAHFGADRLIWTNDIHLLAESLDQCEWSSFRALVADKDVAEVCRAGLQVAQVSLGTRLPREILGGLEGSSRKTSASAYLSYKRALPRAWLDLRAVPGFGSKLGYLRSRLLPTSGFLRSKYPQMAGMPLPVLVVRRMASLLRRRSR